jgi:hypothetical protein
MKPDILDADTKEVYEIKPRNEIREGLIQLAGYLTSLNEVFTPGLTEPAPLASLSLPGLPNIRGVSYTQAIFTPGLWNPPSRFYLVPPNKITIATLIAPGLIIYDLYNLSNLKQAFLQVTLSAIALGLVLGLIPGPVDDAAVILALPELINAAAMISALP